MASSALLRRWSAAQLLRSGAVANSSYSHPCIGGNSLAAANRGSVTAPWLMMKPCTTTGDDVVWRFYCFANNRIYSFIPEEYIQIREPQMHPYAELVGSSHGWLASHDQHKYDMFLLDPITNRHLNLPPLMGERVHNLILGDGEKKAFIIFGSGHTLAFYSLQGGSHEWTLFGGGDYESVVYSSRHRRLFCITSTLKLEGWDVGGDAPRLDNDWEAQLELEIPARPGFTKLYYIVCAEQSGELFVVVRHVRLGGGSWVERGVEREYVGPTVDFEVYKVKIDDEEEEFNHKLMRMEDCLGGVTMFVGNNHPIVMKPDVGGGVKPDSIYFGYDSRVSPLELDGYDYGSFDCRKGALCRHKNPYQLYHGVRAVWFTPRPRPRPRP